MFTGIIEELGKIQKITNNSIVIECEKVLEETKIGDSIAVNGVCLTVKNIYSNSFEANVSNETFKVTNIKTLKVNSFVNLERAMTLNGRFGGHIVSGHIDGIEKIVSIIKNNEFYEIQISIDKTLEKYVVKKGSVTINGISLTVADVQKGLIKLVIIPHTFNNTNLKYLKNNDYVNIEVDILSKYVENFLSIKDNRTGIDLEFLQQNGF